MRRAPVTNDIFCPVDGSLQRSLCLIAHHRGHFLHRIPDDRYNFLLTIKVELSLSECKLPWVGHYVLDGVVESLFSQIVPVEANGVVSFRLLRFEGVVGKNGQSDEGHAVVDGLLIDVESFVIDEETGLRVAQQILLW